jgi:hypothetical protein
MGESWHVFLKDDGTWGFESRTTSFLPELNTLCAVFKIGALRDFFEDIEKLDYVFAPIEKDGRPSPNFPMERFSSKRHVKELMLGLHNAEFVRLAVPIAYFERRAVEMAEANRSVIENGAGHAIVVDATNWTM